MEAKLERNGEVLVVRLKGQLDFESADAFRATCLKHLRAEKVVFNLQELSFVGSSGITPFLETVVELSGDKSQGLKLCGVGTEFRRVFQAREMESLEIYEDEGRAAVSFYHQHVEVAPVASYNQPQAQPQPQAQTIPSPVSNPIGQSVFGPEHLEPQQTLAPTPEQPAEPAAGINPELSGLEFANNGEPKES